MPGDAVGSYYKRYEGINTPYLYIGAPKSIFAIVS